MFWDKGYTPSQNIEALLEKENVTVEEFLDDEDILQECKSQKKSIVNYFTRPDVIKRLVELITTEPSEELPLAQRFRHANMACEILALGLPSLDEKLLSDADTFKTLYSYLENEPPLNPLLSSFFSKTFSMLFTKKPEQDWFLYQQTCLKLLEYIKLEKNFLDLICKHFSTPIIPDLIMQMMRDVEGGQLKRNLYEWLTEDKLVERLITILGSTDEIDKHSNVSEFLCDLIQQGRTMRQTEYENDSFEPAFEGSNPILKAIESADTIETLLNVILEPNAQESAIVSGISVVLTLIKPLVFMEEPNSDRLKFIQNREKEIHENIIATVIRVIAPRLKDFHELLSNPPNKPEIVTTATKLKPPFGITRLQICRLFTVLLQTHNEQISKAICETSYFETLLVLFKQYCWNNFLHSEVEKCLHLIFYTQLCNNSAQGSTIVNDGSFSKNYNNDIDNNTSSFFDYFKTGSAGNCNFVQNKNDEIVTYDSIIGGGAAAADSNKLVTKTTPAAAGGGEEEVEKSTAAAADDDENNEISNENKKAKNEINPLTDNAAKPSEDQSINVDDVNVDDVVGAGAGAGESESKTLTNQLKTAVEDVDSEMDEKLKDGDNAMQVGGDNNDNIADNKDTTKMHTDIGPSELQTHVIEKCKLISKLIDCWQHNRESESAEKGRRLGYMGHLIKIFKHITICISESEHIGALIENNFSDANELELWQSIINPNDGDFTKALATQSKMLANCNAHETGDYSQHLPKDFLADNSTWDYIMSSNINNLAAFNDASTNDIVFALEHEMYRNDDNMNADNDLKMFDFCRNIDEDDDDDEEDVNGAGDGSFLQAHALFTKGIGTFRTSNNPWEDVQPFSNTSTPWSSGVNSDGFADFDSYFNTFTSDLGESLNSPNKDQSSNRMNELKRQADNNLTNKLETGSSEAAYDNNANNVERVAAAAAAVAATTRLLKRPSVENLSITEDDDNAKNEKVVTALVRTLHSVMHDSEDDYEDDEGMWTKPLGGGGSATEETASGGEEEEAEENKLAEQQKDTADLALAKATKLINGPSSSNSNIQTTLEDDNTEKDNAELTKSDDKASYSNKITENQINNSEIMPNDAEDAAAIATTTNEAHLKLKQLNNDKDATIDATTTTTKTAVEVASTTTTATTTT